MNVTCEAVSTRLAQVTVSEDADDVNPPTLFVLNVSHVRGREFRVALLTGDVLDFDPDQSEAGIGPRALYNDTIEAG